MIYDRVGNSVRAVGKIAAIIRLVLTVEEFAINHADAFGVFLLTVIYFTVT